MKKTRQKRGNGGLRYRNGKYEGTYVLHRYNGTRLVKSFTRETCKEINKIKRNLKQLEILDNTVEDVHIDKNTNVITIVEKYRNTKVFYEVCFNSRKHKPCV